MLTYRLTEIGATVDDMGEFCERQRREPVAGSGGIHPQKILKSEGPKNTISSTLRPIAVSKLKVQKQRCHQL